MYLSIFCWVVPIIRSLISKNYSAAPYISLKKGGGEMEFFKYGGIALAALCGLVLLILAFKSGKPLRILLLNAFLGISVLILINLTTRFTGVHIPINRWTAGFSAGFGIPAVGLFVMLPLIFNA